MMPVVLTADQCRYLHLGPSADGKIEPQGDLAITDYDRDGWIFVEQAVCMGENGSGVWVDTKGVEHHGAMGPVEDTSPRATAPKR
jgi:hypothetical protein